MDRFSIQPDQWVNGFLDVIPLDISKEIAPQLRRKFLHHRRDPDALNIAGIRKVIENNSSLRVSFGWSFESAAIYQNMMNECVKQVTPMFSIYSGNMIADNYCDWLGFIPLDIFSRAVLEELNAYSLIVLNNDMIGFQVAVVEFIANHLAFKQHSLMRNDDYRFNYYKGIRKDSVSLYEAFHYYMDSMKETCGINKIPRQFVEEAIGCHYLNHPDTFFELIEFYKLKGEIYE